MRGHARVLIAIALLAVLALFALAALWYRTSASPPSPAERAARVGMRAARQQMVWSAGPRLQSERVIRLAQLDATLRAVLPASVRANVNVPSLVNGDGRATRVAVLVLQGTYNSLPPDEGIDVTGDVLVLVAMRSHRVLLLMD